MKFSISKDGVVTDEFGIVHYKSSISQQDAREAVHQTIEDKGMVIEEEWEMDDDSIEITVISES